MSLSTYISPEGLARLKDYRYSGTDLSYWYKYVSSPLAEAIVARLPRWIAPNLITLSAFFFCVVSSHVAIWWFGGAPHGFKDISAPRIVFLIAAVALLAYQTLDNADGKQARKLGVGSPVGLLLDHGCDAISSVMVSINVLTILAFDPVDEIWFIVLPLALTIAAFFFATWEEYVTGTLVLGKFNGANEAIVIVALFEVSEFLFPGISQSICFGWKVKWLLGIFMVCSCIWSIYWNISMASFFMAGRKVAKGKTKPVENHHVHSGSAVEAFLLTTPLFVLLTVGFGWFVLSKNQIFISHPRACIWLVGINFSKLVTHLMLAHVSGEVYQPWRKTFVLPTLLITGNIASGFAIDEVSLLYGCLLFSLISWSHMIFFVLKHMLRTLKIKLLTVPKSVWKGR